VSRVIIFLFSLFISFSSQATHIRCGHIALRLVNGLTYEVKLTIYTNIGSPVKVSDGTLDFGDGSTPHNLPTIENTIRPDLGSGVGIVEYSINHTFPKSGYYIITYQERNLHAGILNVANSVNTKFYLETRVNLDSETSYSSPLFLAEPIFKQAVGSEFSFSNAAIDVNGNRLSYESVSPLESSNAGFSLPENFIINYFNGLVTWDTKYKGNYSAGEYLFAMRVTQYNKNGGIIGQLIRTFEINLEEINTGSPIKISNPITQLNNRIFIENGKSKTFKVLAQSETEQVEWAEFHDPALSSNFSFSQIDSLAGSKNIKVGIVKLNSSTNIIRDNPYSITLRAKSIDLDKQVRFKDITYLFFTKDIELPLPPTVVTVVTGIGEQGSDKIKGYPNPFSNHINFDSNNLNTQIEILDSKGQSVVNTSLNEDGHIDTSSFAKGLYIILIKNGSNVFVQKLVKE
jgi:Secretion system C-terminal sorting domain